jgi:3-oxoacyl-[acyl-carrier protein] reductase
MSARTALVTGGKGDIGTSIVAHLAAQGMQATAAGRQDFDLTVPAQIDAFLGARPAYDVLVHCAGYNVPKRFDQLEDAELRLSLEANLHGFLHVARRLLPYWAEKKSGHVVVISSLYGQFGRAGRLPYVMAKHALLGAVKTLAIEWAPLGIMVNAVSPGYIATKLTYRNNSPEKIAQLVAGIPAGRLGEGRDIAEVVAFLAAESNRYLTGQDITVDGGYSVGGFQG